jgi:hypothetical protein
LLKHTDPDNPPVEGCVCPKSLEELSKCLYGCLNDANCGIEQKFTRIKAAILIDDELSLEKSTLTPTMKAVPKRVFEVYKAQLESLYDEAPSLNEKVYVIRLDTETDR